MTFKSRVCVVATGVVAVAAAASPVAMAGSHHGKGSPKAHESLASCGQAENSAQADLYSRYSAYPGGVTRSYTILGWWSGCHGPYGNTQGATQWATYPTVRYNITGRVTNAQVNVDPYGTDVYEANMPG
jgi:hypothetical protein